jgi:hypothetical protein
MTCYSLWLLNCKGRSRRNWTRFAFKYFFVYLMIFSIMIVKWYKQVIQRFNFCFSLTINFKVMITSVTTCNNIRKSNSNSVHVWINMFWFFFQVALTHRIAKFSIQESAIQSPIKRSVVKRAKDLKQVGKVTYLI